jgi:replicative DNA helicase
MTAARMPYDAHAEAQVIGSLMCSHDAVDRLADALTAEDFYDTRNAKIWAAAIALSTRGQVVNYTTIRSELEANKDLASVREEYLLEVSGAVATSALAERYAEIVRNRSRTRAMIEACQSGVRDGYDCGAEPGEYLERTEAAVFQAAHDREKARGYASAQTVVQERFKQLSEHANSGGGMLGITTGLADLDTKLRGMKPGQLLVVAARPAMGKSALAGHIAKSLAADGKTGAVFSLEMPREEWIDRWLFSEARVSPDVIHMPGVSRESCRDSWSKLGKAAATISGWRVWIDDQPAITVLALRSRCRRLKSKEGLDYVLVDYMQLMRSGSKHGGREEEIAEISRSLKALAKELQVPVVVLAQLNRKCEERTDKRPMLSDLRESGSIEQDADVVIMIYRDEVYNKDTRSPNEAELIVAKHRGGPTGTVRVFFEKEFTRFGDIDWTNRASPEEETEDRFRSQFRTGRARA